MSALGKRLTLCVVILAIACVSKNEAGNSGSAARVTEDESAEATFTRAPNGLIGSPDNNPGTQDYVLHHIKFDNNPTNGSGFIDDFACNGCAAPTVKLKVIAEKQAHKVDWPSALVNREHEGWIVAKVVNVDPSHVVFDELELAFNDTAYQWIGPVSPDGKETAVAWYKIDRAKGKVTGGPFSKITKVTYCDDPKWGQRTHGLAMRNHPNNDVCPSAIYAPPGAPASSQKKPRFPDGGMWVSCTGGCCNVSDLE